MEELGIGADLGALAFWLFIAAVVVATYWDNIKKRESQHETLRRIVESGNQFDEETMQRLMNLSTGGSSRADRDLKVTAMWTLPIAPGLAVLAFALRELQPEAYYPIIGAAGMVAVMAIGFWIAGSIVARWYEE